MVRSVSTIELIEDERLTTSQLVEKRSVALIKALEEKQTKEAGKKYGSKDSVGVLGEILGPLLNKKKIRNNYTINLWLDQNCYKSYVTITLVLFVRM